MRCNYVSWMCALVLAFILAALIERSSATVFTPTQSQFDAMGHGVILSSNPNDVFSITDDPTGGLDITLTFPQDGQENFFFNYPPSPPTDFSGFASYDLQFSKINTSTLVGAFTFLVDRTNDTEIDNAANPTALINDFFIDLSVPIAGTHLNSAPFDTTHIQSWGFVLSGAAGTTGSVHVAPLPEPASIAIVGSIFIALALRRPML